MKDILLISFAFFALVIFGCKKSSPPAPAPESLKDQLQGTWTITDHLAINLPDNLTNDTTAPSHTETFVFTGDTLMTDGWYSATLNQTTNPPSFTVTQNTEFKDTASFVTGDGYIIAHILTHYDTMYVNTISSTQLVLQQNLTTLGWVDITELSK
jgi:hypothetical protein